MSEKNIALDYPVRREALRLAIECLSGPPVRTQVSVLCLLALPT
jgi:hypothetical protein